MGLLLQVFSPNVFNLFRATNLYPDLRTLEDFFTTNDKHVELEERLHKALVSSGLATMAPPSSTLDTFSSNLSHCCEKLPDSLRDGWLILVDSLTS